MQLRMILVLAAIAAAALGVATATSGVAAAGGKTVKLGDDFFKPAKVSVSKGTTVRFKWVGDNAHNVTKKKGPGGSFRSETTDRRGVNYKKKFKKSGTYKLICTIHADTMRMKLKVR